MLTKISSQIIVGCLLADSSNEDFASQTSLNSARQKQGEKKVVDEILMQA
jgi:hypothetical protein